MRKGKVLEGKVTSDKNEKTITVMVIKKFPHSTYKKLAIKRKKYRVHDAKNSAKTGDRVRIVEARPFSKNKNFELLEIIK